ncbi:hypothetical protein ACT3TE_18495 [Brachybacterium sp. AOP42-B2-9]
MGIRMIGARLIGTRLTDARRDPHPGTVQVGQRLVQLPLDRVHEQP